MSSASKRHLEIENSPSTNDECTKTEISQPKKPLLDKPTSTTTELKLDALVIYKTDPGKREWWKKTVIYEVYVRSFFDSNGDGIGDLKGIESKLDYFVDLDVETLWLSPFCTSPMKDFGYDISNFMDVDPIFGTLEDFKSLLKSMKNKGLKLIMDFVPNHTSDQHEWFVKSCQKIEPFTDFYIWKPAKSGGTEDKEDDHKLPNNWVSVFGGSMWEWNEERGEFYLHQFTKEQPDLNFRNPLVIEEIKKVFRFWLDLGVDGFRLDAVSHIFEDPEFHDETPAKIIQKLEIGQASESMPLPNEYGYWDHPYTSNLPEVLDLIATFRTVLDEYSNRDNHPRLMMTEAYLSVQELMEYYGTDERPVADFPFNFEIISNLSKGFHARDIYNIVNNWMKNLPPGKWSNWLTGNHDVMRMSTKWGSDRVDLLHMIILLLPGTAVTYYGEEIGMENTELSWEETVDPAGLNVGPCKFKQFSRDPERTPMQWNHHSKNAGFSSADKTWLPVNSNFQKINVESEQQAVEESHFKIYKKLTQARNLESFLSGHLEMQVLDSNNVFAFTRISDVSDIGLLVVINFGTEPVHANTSSFQRIATTLKVYAQSSSGNSKEPGSSSDKEIDSSSIFLNPLSGIVFTFTPITNKK